MNARIELVNDNYVVVHGRRPVHAYVGDAELHVDGFVTGDRPAVEAMVDVLNCYLATGDFAALADTSAAPFVGKKVRVKGWGDTTHTISNVYCNGNVRCRDSLTILSPANLLPLVESKPPQPKYRPYATLDEAKELMNISVTKDCRTITAWAIGDDRVVAGAGETISFTALFKHWTKSDGTPCGVKVEE